MDCRQFDGKHLFLNLSVALVFAVHVLLGLVLASWSLFIALPFSTCPQLGAVVAPVSAIISMLE